MEGFVLTNLTRDRYIYFDKHRKMSVTTDINRAEVFYDSGKAYHVLENQIPKKKRDAWIVVAKESKPKQEKPQRFKAELDFSDSEKIFDWESLVSNITNSYQGILDYKEFLEAELTKVETELFDIEHAIEFFSLNACEGFKMYKLFHDKRVKRRQIKNELRKATAILGMSYEQITSGEIEKVFETVENQSYEPRILTDLFLKKPLSSENMDTSKFSS